MLGSDAIAITMMMVNKMMPRMANAVAMIPHTRLTVPRVVDMLTDLDLLRDITPRMMPPMLMPMKLRTRPMIPSVCPGFSTGCA